MRKVCTLTAILVFASALAYAETWTGKLFDASCVDQQKNEQKTGTCTPTSGTSSFAIQVSGKILKLDADGNRKAAEAWREYNNSADRAKDPEMKSDQVTATVDGTMSGDEIKVESIQIR
jgi:hypothetical protein